MYTKDPGQRGEVVKCVLDAGVVGMSGDVSVHTVSHFLWVALRG